MDDHAKSVLILWGPLHYGYGTSKLFITTNFLFETGESLIL